jgi:hypothetical protein
VNVIPLISLSQIPLDRPTLIYGSGRGGRLIARSLRLTTEVLLAGFVDTYRAGGIDGMPVYRISDLEIPVLSRTTLIVASIHFDEIYETLRKLPLAVCYDGRPMFPLYHCYDPSLADEVFVELFEATLDVYRRFAPDRGKPAERRSVQVKCV